jgi:hypothetical protein
MHSMRDGAHNQTIDDAQRQSVDYVNTELDAAVQAQLTSESNGAQGLNDDALTHFGHALHTVTDATSPEHAGFQPWFCLVCRSAYKHHNDEENSANSSLDTDEHARYLAHRAAADLWQRYQEELRNAREKKQREEEKKKQKGNTVPAPQQSTSK